MIRTTLLSLTLIACNTFDAQKNADEPTNPSYKIVDASDSINIAPERNDFLTPNSVVMTLPELGLEVIEQDPEVATQPDSENSGLLDFEQPKKEDESLEDATNDELVKFIEVESLLPDSELTAEITAERSMKIIAVSTFPTSILKESKTEHALRILLPEESVVYTSEILQSIVLAVQYDANSVYIPLTAENMPEIIFEGVDYAQSEGIRVYDVYGNLL